MGWGGESRPQAFWRRERWVSNSKVPPPKESFKKGEIGAYQCEEGRVSVSFADRDHGRATSGLTSSGGFIQDREASWLAVDSGQPLLAGGGRGRVNVQSGAYHSGGSRGTRKERAPDTWGRGLNQSSRTGKAGLGRIP